MRFRSMRTLYNRLDIKSSKFGWIPGKFGRITSKYGWMPIKFDQHESMCTLVPNGTEAKSGFPASNLFFFQEWEEARIELLPYTMASAHFPFSFPFLQIIQHLISMVLTNTGLHNAQALHAHSLHTYQSVHSVQPQPRKCWELSIEARQ